MSAQTVNVSTMNARTMNMRALNARSMTSLTKHAHASSANSRNPQVSP